jgi:hypothetical protein
VRCVPMPGLRLTPTFVTEPAAAEIEIAQPFF